MRLFFGIVLLMISMGISLYLLQKNKKKVEFCEDLCSFHSAMKSACTYRKSIIKLFDDFQCHGEFATMLESVKGQIVGGDDISIVQERLTESQLSEINAYFSGISTINQFHQSEFFKNYEATFDKWKKQEQETYEKCKKTYLKLGFMFGLILLIIVI